MKRQEFEHYVEISKSAKIAANSSTYDFSLAKTDVRVLGDTLRECAEASMIELNFLVSEMKLIKAAHPKVRISESVLKIVEEHGR